jgi:hypothetical protein
MRLSAAFRRPSPQHRNQIGQVNIPALIDLDTRGQIERTKSLQPLNALQCLCTGGQGIEVTGVALPFPKSLRGDFRLADTVDIDDVTRSCPRSTTTISSHSVGVPESTAIPGSRQNETRTAPSDSTASRWEIAALSRLRAPPGSIASPFRIEQTFQNSILIYKGEIKCRRQLPPHSSFPASGQS